MKIIRNSQRSRGGKNVETRSFSAACMVKNISVISPKEMKLPGERKFMLAMGEVMTFD